MPFFEYAEYDAIGLSDLVRSGQVTPVEVVEAAIASAERAKPAVNAIVYQAFDEARESAATGPVGPFAGVPMLIKDLGLTVKNWPRTSGSRF